MTSLPWHLVDAVTERLANAGVPSPDVDARRLVEHVAEHLGDPAVGCNAQVLDALVERRAAREPLQQVLGRTWFRHLTIGCRPGVFVPRPETEVVAGLAIAAATRSVAPTVLEPCTGTGAIALAAASEVPQARVIAGDRSPEAVAVAGENLAAVAASPAPTPWQPGPWLAPGATVAVHHGDLFDAFPAELRGEADVIVCNPPYLPESDLSTWEPEVAAHDPHDALIAGPDGHEVVDRALAEAPRWLRPGGTVVVEIDDRRGADAAAAAAAAGLVDVRIEPDLTGRDRAVVARRAEEAT